MRGICIDTRDSEVLIQGEPYFLFPNGESRFYVSKFNNPGAHFGCYSKNHFKMSPEEEWTAEPPFSEELIETLDREKRYQATLIWREKGYRTVELKKYYLEIKQTHAFFFEDSECKKCRGCFPLHWFIDFEVINDKITEPVVVIPEPEFLPADEWEQLRLF